MRSFDSSEATLYIYIYIYCVCILANDRRVETKMGGAYTHSIKGHRHTQAERNPRQQYIYIYIYIYIATMMVLFFQLSP
jgi:hypothetical protein